MDILREKHGKHEKAFLLYDNKCVTEFLDYLCKDYNCSKREFSREFMDVSYDMGYSLLSGRRNATMNTLFHILKRLGYTMMIVPNTIIDNTVELSIKEPTHEGYAERCNHTQSEGSYDE